MIWTPRREMSEMMSSNGVILAAALGVLFLLATPASAQAPVHEDLDLYETALNAARDRFGFDLSDLRVVVDKPTARAEELDDRVFSTLIQRLNPDAWIRGQGQRPECEEVPSEKGSSIPGRVCSMPEGADVITTLNRAQLEGGHVVVKIGWSYKIVSGVHMGATFVYLKRDREGAWVVDRVAVLET